MTLLLGRQDFSLISDLYIKSQRSTSARKILLHTVLRGSWQSHICVQMLTSVPRHNQSPFPCQPCLRSVFSPDFCCVYWPWGCASNWAAHSGLPALPQAPAHLLRACWTSQPCNLTALRDLNSPLCQPFTRPVRSNCEETGQKSYLEIQDCCMNSRIKENYFSFRKRFSLEMFLFASSCVLQAWDEGCVNGRWAS